MIPTLVGSEGGDFGVRVSLKPNFDGIITMNIFLNPGSATSYSWVSLQAVAFDKGSGSISTACLLGAQNVVFDSAATRLARFASPTALELLKTRKSKPLKEELLAADTQTPAIGWWFRSQLTDINAYPRTGQASHSPGMQLLIDIASLLTRS